MTAEHPAPIDYASPAPAAAPAPRPGFWLVVCGAFGWLFTILGGLGVLANGALLLATWYFRFPMRPEDRPEQLKVFAATVAYTLLGLVFLRLRYRKRGAR